MERLTRLMIMMLAVTHWSSAFAQTIPSGYDGGQSTVDNVVNVQQIGNHNLIYVDQIGNSQQIYGVGGSSAQIYGDGNQITINQGDKVSRAGQSQIGLMVNGDFNALNLNQGSDLSGNSSGEDLGAHYQAVQINGSSNNLDTSQVGQNNHAGIAINGNNNTQSMVQLGTGLVAVTNINGSNNQINTTQNGTGGHMLSIDLTGNNNSATVDQLGSVQNKANINLINAGGPSSVNLTQTGGQTYSISQICVTSSGCGTITIRQGN